MLQPQSAMLALPLCLLLAAGGCGDSVQGEPASPPIPERAEDVQPLEVGEDAATVEVRTLDGEVVALSDLYASGPTMLVFYRGGWCPYCSVQLSALAEAETELSEMGFQVLAISPDRPEKLKEAVDEHDFEYRLLSDSDMVASMAFGLAFRVDDATVENYQDYGIDLEAASGRDHQLLPVPAVYMIDEQGVIRFAHWDADYKARLDVDALLSAARSIAEGWAD